jgi:hypothetical protein
MKITVSAMVVFVALCLAACNRDSPQAIADQTKRLGVYLQTSSGLTEIPVYGTPNRDVLRETLGFEFNGPIPQSEKPLAFVVNLPDARISDAQLFALPNLKKARWHYFDPGNEGDPKPIASGIEPVVGSIYKVIPTGLPKGFTGHLCLLVKMPMGISDRMYAVQLSH